MNDADSRVIANAARQAELEARGRDLTKPMPPPGSDAESLRAIRGFEGITDEMLREREQFSLRAAGIAPNPPLIANPTQSVVDLTQMSTAELEGLAQAAMSQLAQNQKEKSNAQG